MKARTVLGIIGIAVVAGAFLGGLFPKFGTGNGWGSGSGGTPSLDNVVTDATSRPPPGQNVEAARPASPAEDSNVLQVRIDGRDYEMADGMENGQLQYKPVSLEALVEAAKSYAGDGQGIRVRVARLSSAKAAAEVQLRDALVNAGLTPESIDWRDGPAP